MKVVSYKFKDNIGHRVGNITSGYIVRATLPPISLKNWTPNLVKLHSLDPQTTVEVKFPLANYSTSAEFAERIRSVLPHYLKLEEKNGLFQWRNLSSVPVKFEYPVEFGASADTALGRMMCPKDPVGTVSPPFPICPKLGANRVYINPIPIEVPYHHVVEGDPNKRVSYTFPWIWRKFPDTITMRIKVDDNTWDSYSGDGNTIDFYLEDPPKKVFLGINLQCPNSAASQE